MHKSNKLESGDSDKGDLVFFFLVMLGTNWIGSIGSVLASVLVNSKKDY